MALSPQHGPSAIAIGLLSPRLLNRRFRNFQVRWLVFMNHYINYIHSLLFHSVPWYTQEVWGCWGPWEDHITQGSETMLSLVPNHNCDSDVQRSSQDAFSLNVPHYTEYKSGVDGQGLLVYNQLLRIKSSKYTAETRHLYSIIQKKISEQLLIWCRGNSLIINAPSVKSRF